MSDWLTLRTSVDRRALPPGAAEIDLKCQVELRASPELLAAVVEPVRSHLCLVLDGSGSMIGDRLRQALRSAELLVDTLGAGHALSLVLFHAGAEVLIDHSPMTPATKGPARKKIQDLRHRVGGSTNIAAGISLAASVLEKGKADAKVMVVLTDGEADDPAAAEKAALAAAAAGCQLFAVGVGAEFDAEWLLRLVRLSGGAVFGHEDVQKLVDTFQTLLGRVQSYVATQARLSVTFAPGVQIGAAYRLSPDRALLGTMAADAERTVTLPVGNIERNEVYAFLWVITLRATETGILELAKLRVTYQVPALPQPAHVQEAAISVVCQPAAEPAYDPEVSQAFSRASLLQAAQDFADAARAKDLARGADSLKKLIHGCEQLGDTGRASEYRALLANVESRGDLSRSAVNAVLVGASAKETPTERGNPTMPPSEPPPPSASPRRRATTPKRVDPDLVVSKRDAEPEPVEPEPAPTPTPSPEAQAPAIPPPLRRVDPDLVARGRSAEPKTAAPEPTPAPPAKPQAPAGPPPLPSRSADPAPTGDTGKYDVVLIDPGKETIPIVRELREVMNVSIKDAAQAAKRSNISVRKGVSQATAVQIMRRLTDAGGRVEIKPASRRSKSPAKR